MREAVIVSVCPHPGRRAKKGSLKDTRPEELRRGRCSRS